MTKDPFTHEYKDFDPLGDPDSCQRDYTITCPTDFYLMPETFDTTVRVCAPSYKYKGACMAGDFPHDAMTSQDKREWAIRCRRNWPCIECPRDFSKPCPSGWKEYLGVGSPVAGCVPPTSYRGPCKIPATGISFEHFNSEMMEAWSDQCKAWWPCIVVEEPPLFSSPISVEATAWRIMKGLQ